MKEKNKTCENKWAQVGLRMGMILKVASQSLHDNIVNFCPLDLGNIFPIMGSILC